MICNSVLSRLWSSMFASSAVTWSACITPIPRMAEHTANCKFFRINQFQLTMAKWCFVIIRSLRDVKFTAATPRARLTRPPSEQGDAVWHCAILRCRSFSHFIYTLFPPLNLIWQPLCRLFYATALLRWTVRASHVIQVKVVVKKWMPEYCFI